MEPVPVFPQFFVVYVLDAVMDEFVIGGIFSKEADAEQYKAECEANPIYRNAVAIDRLTMDQIKTQLVKDRLMGMGAAIERLVTGPLVLCSAEHPELVRAVPWKHTAR